MNYNRYEQMQRWPGYVKQWRAALLAWWNANNDGTQNTFEEYERWYWELDDTSVVEDDPCQMMFY
jgi:hypothetical protein